MKNKVIFIVAISVAIILLSITMFNNKENPASNQSNNSENPIIGGDRDEHGCLGPAGYSWNETLGFCLREWEIKGDYREAIEFSSKYITKEYGLTVDSVENATCLKCFTIWYETLGHKRSVDVSPSKNYCPEPRAEGIYCIQSWEPVCAFGNFGNKTFSNSCTACLNESVSYYFFGECQ